MKNTILVTGAAGFIGYHLINNINKKFKNKITIIGIDNINNYYSQKLKLDRVKNLKKKNKNFIFKKIDIRNYKNLSNLFKDSFYCIYWFHFFTSSILFFSIIIYLSF